MTSRVTQIASLPVLTLLVNAAAWAGRGDIDPNYGEGGRLTMPPAVVLALPGDRLVTGEGTGEGLRVRMFDATGQIVSDFGEAGVVLIDSSTAARTFQPEAVALAPNGDMIFMGSLSDTGTRGILRLDSDGQPVPSFGNRGDGFVEPAPTSSMMAIDPAGKIVLADGSRNPDGSCGSTARLQRLLANGQRDVEFRGDGIMEIANLYLCDGEGVFGARADGGVIVGNGNTIVAVDATGNIDPTFGVDGRLIVSDLYYVGGMSFPDGGLLIFGSRTLTGTRHYVFRKFDRNGRPDLDFGAGTGSATVNLDAELLGVPSGASGAIRQLVLDPDGEHVVAHLQFGVSGGNGYARTFCSGIARLSIDGTPDAGFGRNGLTCLNTPFALLAVQSDGAPIFSTTYDSSIHRLLPDSSPSPGFLRVVAAYGSDFLSESGTATVAIIERLAGRDGAVSIDYTMVGRPGLGYPATAGSDYIATSGRLDWASGDDSQRTVVVSILDDNIVEPGETFGVDFLNPSGGVQLIGASISASISSDDMPASISSDDGASSTSSPPASGGGGASTWATLLALLTLLLMRRRRVNRR